MEKSHDENSAQMDEKVSVNEADDSDEPLRQSDIMKMDIKSTAVVKYSAVQAPAQFYKLQSNTDLNLPPDNWLRESDRWQVLKGNWTSTGTTSTIFSSLHMANVFPDCVGEVDVVSDAENIKQLLKIPYSKSPVSMMVHRIGKTLLIDDFDIHQHLLQAAKQEWEWLRKFFLEHILETLQHKNQTCFRRNKSRGYLQHKNMLSKFLYYSLADSPDSLVPDTHHDDRQKERSSHQVPATPINSNQAEPIPLPAEEPEASREVHDYQRNVLWTFEDIRMLIGTDMPIFGGGTHPCVSLRLREITKPINVLTGLDYWLDNLMCNVPEVMMCYHLDGIVQKYELIKTEDIPQMDNSKFSPKVIKDIAQNILSFLKSNATKAGHTYWLFKAKDDDVVKLYDLTNLCADIMDDKQQNPFTIPVAMLLYRVAQNMKAARPSKSQRGTICTLLKNCLALLHKRRHPQVATSAHYLLSDLYVPSSIDISSLALPMECDSDGEDDAEDEDNLSKSVGDRKNGAENAELLNIIKERMEDASVSVKALCLPQKCKYNYSNEAYNNQSLSGTLADRCTAALYHVEEGLNCLECSTEESLEYDLNSEMPAERNREDVQERAKPFQPIPLHYEPINPHKTPLKTDEQMPNCGANVYDEPSACDSKQRSEKDLPVASKANHWLLSGSWQSFYVGLLFQKASVAAYAMAQSLRDTRHGEALRYVELALCCYDVIEQIVSSGFQSQYDKTMLACYIFGLAGDLHFMLVQHSARTSEYKEQYEKFSQFEGITKSARGILDRECRYQWAAEFQSKIENSLILSSRCYKVAFETAYNDEDKMRLRKRIGNIKNELGVFHMSQAHSLFKDTGELSGHIENLWKSSSECLEKGAKIFEEIQDCANIALLNSNLGRLMRLRAVCCAPQKDGPKELTATERQFYDKAIYFYQKALRSLSDKKEFYEIRDSISWDLSTTHFTVASLMQDYAPLSIKPREEVEKDISEYMLKALKYCDVETTGAKQPIYQYRAAAIHHRLGSLNHHSYRNLAVGGSRKKQYRALAEMHLSKAANLLCILEDSSEYLHVQLERIGLSESHFSGLLGNSAKVKCLHTHLELIFETIPVVTAIRDQRASESLNQLIKKCDRNSAENSTCAEDESVALATEDTVNDQINKFLGLVQQRLQFALLNLVKIFSSKAKKGNDALLVDYKKMYNESLQLSLHKDIFSLDTNLENLLRIQMIFSCVKHR